jgi:serine/threonine protein kinase/formylglycine-generating enzyme required for sulfatase activity
MPQHNEPPAPEAHANSQATPSAADSDGATSADWSPPKQFDEYRLLWPLSRGGMGEVFLGHDTLLDRPVAIKFISAINPDSAVREQFLNEARAAARLQHPNVVTIYRVGEVDGRPLIVSEYVRGQNLDAVPKPLPWRRALEIGLGLARGLAAAHRRGVLHRDIKPGNVIISSDGEIKLLDFGLAEFIDRANLSGPEAWAPEAGAGPVSGTSETMQIPVEQAHVMAVDRSPSGRHKGVENKEFVVVLGRAASSSEHMALAESSSEYRALVSSAEHRALASTPPAGSVPVTADSSQENLVSVGKLRVTGRQRSALSGEAEALAGKASKPRPEPAALKAADRLGYQSTPQGSAVFHTSRIAGTPLYMAPEIWRGEPGTRQTDIYAMGSLLFELCAGAPPHIEAPLADLPRIVCEEDAAPLRRVAPDVDARFAAIVDRCLRRDATKRFASGDELREALESLKPNEQQAPAPEGNPYRGLLAFEAEHRGLFFGRSNEIGTIVDRLRTEAFVLVTADSGVGKSSLCRAGVLPLVAEGALGGSRKWTVLTMVPGRTPLAALIEVLAPVMGVPAEQLGARLRAEPTALAWELRKHLGEERGVTLFIDQLEELVTIADPIESALVGAALGRLTARVPGVRMLMTVRSDFLARVATVPGLGDELARGLYLLRPMTADKIREAIVGPAHAKGVHFESEAMVESLAETTAKTDGGLPLLQFALTELWDARQGSSITQASLDRIGGVSGALARHADQVLLSLPAAQRIAARRILMLLVTLDGTRARRSDEELVRSDAARPALEALVKGRLLVARDTGEGIGYEVAHEALLRGWGTLKRWLEEFAESRQVKGRLEASANEWRRFGQTKEALWSARQLAETSLLDESELTPREQAFLAASRRAVARGRWGRRIAIVTVPLFLGSFAGVIKYQERREQRQKVDGYVATGLAALSEARQKAALAEQQRQKSFKAFDAMKKDEGEAEWAKAIEIAKEAEEAVGKASQVLEAALTLDGSRQDVRGLLGDALLEGALIAEANLRPEKMNEMVQRLALYDLDGSRLRRWKQPALLTVTTQPAAAQIQLGRYVPDKRQRRVLQEVQTYNQGSLTAVPVSMGSYLLTISAPGRATVRYPVLIHRNEDLKVELKLPSQNEIPPDFAYIPGGRFLFGSADPEAVRVGILSTIPQHAVTVNSFFMAKTEVTMRDWLEYVKTLPAEARARMAAEPKDGAATGPLVREKPGIGWEVTFKTYGGSVTVRTGEKLVNSKRSTRREQDWLKIPILNLSAQEAEGYLDWLAQTKRVPGARFCTEHEWERAARGADDRIYPHGDTLTRTEANFEETYGQNPQLAGPDEVGSYPDSASPFGILDMAGNATEWTRSSVQADQYVIRGGGYLIGGFGTSTVNRAALDKAFRDPMFGLRVCASVATEADSSR